MEIKEEIKIIDQWGFHHTVIVKHHPDLGISFAYYDETLQQTILHYKVEHTGPVKIELFNITGSRTMLLDELNHPKGDFLLQVNESKFSAGIYFARLEINGQHAMVKFYAPEKKQRWAATRSVSFLFLYP